MAARARWTSAPKHRRPRQARHRAETNPKLARPHTRTTLRRSICGHPDSTAAVELPATIRLHTVLRPQSAFHMVTESTSSLRIRIRGPPGTPAPGPETHDVAAHRIKPAVSDTRLERYPRRSRTLAWTFGAVRSARPSPGAAHRLSLHSAPPGRAPSRLIPSVRGRGRRVQSRCRDQLGRRAPAVRDLDRA